MKLPSITVWDILGIVLAAAIWALAPAQLPVVLYKVALVTFAFMVGTRLEKRFLPASTNDVARAIVLAAVILGLTLGI